MILCKEDRILEVFLLDNVSCLMTVDELIFFDEIDCRNMFSENDSRE